MPLSSVATEDSRKESEVRSAATQSPYEAVPVLVLVLVLVAIGREVTGTGTGTNTRTSCVKSVGERERARWCCVFDWNLEVKI